MNKTELFATITDEIDPKRVLDVYIGFETNHGFFMQVIPTVVQQKDGVTIKNYSGNDIHERILIEGKKFSQKKWEELKLKCSEELLTVVKSDYIYSPYVNGV